MGPLGNRNQPSIAPQIASPVTDWKPHLRRKVSLRYKLHDSDHPFSEAIGVVSGVTCDDKGDQTISILTRSGETRSIPATDILGRRKVFPI